MDYTLHTLGTRNFEHISQALASKLVSSNLSAFGDGADGGREATWQGLAVSHGRLPHWNGYGVVQAKFRIHDRDPADNLDWLKKVITAELDDWAKPNSNRHTKPDYLLFVSNVRLSPNPGNGKDAATAHLTNKIRELGLPIADSRIWDYDDLRTFLDDAEDIRNRYAAFITPGDLISAVLKERDWERADFAEAMQAYLARTLVDDDLLNLTQAGTADDNRISMADVFIDLPYDSEGRNLRLSKDGFDPKRASRLRHRDKASSSLATDLVSTIDESAGAPDGSEQDRFVLIGGPGQGKSTVTQWLAQIYRARFLEGSSAARAREVHQVLEKLRERANAIAARMPSGRRWPFRIVLSALAEELSRNPGTSLIDYIAARVSYRSSYRVVAADLRSWMRTHPWLLLIDGLDEVPESSNRREVMQCLQDFFIDAETVDADVAAIATTRPQGYSDEFSPQEYAHLRLTPLSTQIALGYASSLVTIRTGLGTPDSDKVLARLREASSEEATARLFETPLQVTILTVLLEKLGKAPRDRSRLFSAYYEVIAQREQEKSGHLSRLLQRYESDVLELHRHIGLVLQQRAAAAGETSATLDPEEFGHMVAEQFRKHKHDEDEIVALKTQFTQLIMNRLVFLSVVAADRIGFELRSFQEFMAAEQLVNRREADILPALTEYAPTPYWRNVILFAVGHIFARREHLRGDVLVLCASMNTLDTFATVTLPGSELALDVLLDGSCDSMPLYSAPIADLAARLIERPGPERLDELAGLKESAVRNAVARAASSLAAAGASVWLNRFLILDALISDGYTAAKGALARASIAISDEDLQTVLPIVVTNRANHATDALAERIAVANPLRLLDAAAYSPFDEEDAEPTSTLDRLEALRRFPRSEGGHDYRVEAHYTPLGEDHALWEWLHSIGGEGNEWQALHAIAAFAMAPDEATLSAALRASVFLPRDFVLLIAPWVYNACWRSAANTGGGDNGFRNRLRALADLAESGGLGSSAQWLAVEAMTPTSGELTVAALRELISDTREAAQTTADQPPIATSTTRIPLSGRLLSLTVGHEPLESDLEAIRGMVDIYTQNADLNDAILVASTAKTLASMIFGSRRFSETEPEESTFTDTARSFIDWGIRRAPDDPHQWYGWLGAIEHIEWSDAWLAGLESIGRLPHARLPRSQVWKGLEAQLHADHPRAGLIRLACALNPRIGGSQVIRSAVGRLDSNETTGLGALLPALELLWEDDPWGEATDTAIRHLIVADDEMGLPWLVSAFEASGMVEHAARLARDTASTNPVTSSDFFNLATEGSSSS